MVSASVPTGNGQRREDSVEVAGTVQDAEDALWDLLHNLGVETSTEPL